MGTIKQIQKYIVPAFVGVNLLERAVAQGKGIHGYIADNADVLQRHFGEIGYIAIAIMGSIGYTGLVQIGITIPTMNALYKYYDAQDKKSQGLEAKL
jgi:hypothetical protein